MVMLLKYLQIKKTVRKEKEMRNGEVLEICIHTVFSTKMGFMEVEI